MARNQIPVVTVSEHVINAIAPATWATAGAADDYQWTWQAGDILLVCNLTASSPTYTVVRPVNQYGRGVDYTSPTIGQNTMRMFFPRTSDGWVQSDGTIQIDTTSNDLRFAVLRPRPSLPAS